MDRVQHSPQSDTRRWKDQRGFGGNARPWTSSTRRVFAHQETRRITAFAQGMERGRSEYHPETTKASLLVAGGLQFEPDLKALHPRNQNIRPKIRQQLQVLRDVGLLEFTSLGNYTIKR